MSSLRQLALERFDLDISDQGPNSQLTPADGDAQVHAAASLNEANEVAIADSHASDRLEAEYRELIKATEFEAEVLREAIAQFHDAKLHFEQELEARVQERVSTACHQLLPKVGAAFLADEVSRHIASLDLPTDLVVGLEVGNAKIGESLEAALRDVWPSNQNLDVRENTELDTLRVRVEWRRGGIDFEFDRLLEILCPSAPENIDEHFEAGERDD